MMTHALPGKKILRRMGYLSDQNGILNRYLDEPDAWEEHLQNSSDFILKSLNDRNPDHVTVLGSGWLLDLPLEGIYSRCKSISLVDINHPPQVLHQIRKYPGVIPVKADITGGLIEKCYEQVGRCRKTGTMFDPDALSVPVPDPGIKDRDVFVISLNILDQLDILIKDYIGRWFDLSGEPHEPPAGTDTGRAHRDGQLVSVLHHRRPGRDTYKQCRRERRRRKTPLHSPARREIQRRMDLEVR